MAVSHRLALERCRAALVDVAAGQKHVDCTLARKLHHPPMDPQTLLEATALVEVVVSRT
jgi:hypothetical protein